MRHGATPLALFLVCAIWVQVAAGHCQIPCGIYDDALRFDMIGEHITTVERSMRMIKELGSPERERLPQDMNQLVRWIDNKESHAQEIQDIVSEYFLAQRVKPIADESPMEERQAYVRKLVPLHELLVSAMKAKQSTDEELIEELRSLMAEFREAYLGPEEPAPHE
jgi:nickel superoxide dismutase